MGSGGTAESVAVGDFNGDRHRGHAGVRGERLAERAQDVAFADFDRDGRLDVLAGRGAGVEVWRNTADGFQFSGPQATSVSRSRTEAPPRSRDPGVVPPPPMGSGSPVLVGTAESVAVGDFNGDTAFPDIAVQPGHRPAAAGVLGRSCSPGSSSSERAHGRGGRDRGPARRHGTASPGSAGDFRTAAIFPPPRLGHGIRRRRSWPRPGNAAFDQLLDVTWTRHAAHPENASRCRALLGDPGRPYVAGAGPGKPSRGALRSFHGLSHRHVFGVPMLGHARWTCRTVRRRGAGMLAPRGALDPRVVLAAVTDGQGRAR